MSVLKQKHGKMFSIYNGDCCEVIKNFPDNCMDFSIFSPPFASMFVYSDHPKDMGNCASYDEFFIHFTFLVKELNRVLKSGRLVSVHCSDIPTLKSKDGYMGLKDFPSDIIRLFEREGFHYHSKHIIWKDPLNEAVRKRSRGLLYGAMCKDSTVSRAGLPDYLITFKKHGDNQVPIVHEKGFESYIGNDPPKEYGVKNSHNIWRRYASPVWMDINQTRTLNVRRASEDKDEKHLCPLQLDVIGRAIELWSLPGEVVFTPFCGVGSEVFQAVLMGRRGVGIELKESYFNVSVVNVEAAENKEAENRILTDNDLDDYSIDLDSKGIKIDSVGGKIVELTDLF